MDVMSLFADFSLIDLITLYGYWAIFGIVLLESAGVPLPGETVLISAAVYAGTTGQMDIGLVIAAAAAGAMLGDNLGFWVGREFGFPLLLRHGPKLGLTERRLKIAQYLFLRHGAKIVFFGRFTALLRTFAALLAGANAYPPGRFLLFNAAGGIAWASIMGGGGYLVGRSMEHAVGPFGLAMLGLVALITVAGWRFVRRHEQRLGEEAERALPGPLEKRYTPAAVPELDAA
jgi:membrane protein DedA with SNARE-associated domain